MGIYLDMKRILEYPISVSEPLWLKLPEHWRRNYHWFYNYKCKTYTVYTHSVEEAMCIQDIINMIYREWLNEKERRRKREKTEKR